MNGFDINAYVLIGKQSAPIFAPFEPLAGALSFARSLRYSGIRAGVPRRTPAEWIFP